MRFAGLLIILTVCASGLFSSNAAYAQTKIRPNFDIVVFDLVESNGQLEITNPVIVADSPDYDNQPSFLKNSHDLYFTRIENGQADIWRWSAKKGISSKVVETGLSEFSPTVIPYDKRSISLVRVEADQTQRLWQYSERYGFRPIFKTIKPVGYHVWSGNKLALFILGEPQTLHIASVGSEASTKVDDTIGRCLQKRPKMNQISYTREEANKHRLKIYDFDTRSISSLHFLPGSAEDYIWFGADKIISSDGKSLLVMQLNKRGIDKEASEWQIIHNSSNFKLSGISRLALSSDEKKLAFVYIAP